jgi:ketosteroid isomerase-like protein
MSIDDVGGFCAIAAQRSCATTRTTAQEVSDMKSITIYERQDGGSWKIARDIWNSDHPALRS